VKEQLATFIASYIKNPRMEEIPAILDIFQLKKIQKGGLFKHPFKAIDKIGFLISGSVRVYVLKDNGERITGNVLSNNAFVTDFIGLKTGENTPLAIEVLAPTTMLVAPNEQIKKLLEVNLTFNRLIRECMGDTVVNMIKLYSLFITGTAKDHYEYLLENNPELFKNTPLHYIANMIGITPTQLSRIRKKDK